MIHERVTFGMDVTTYESKLPTIEENVWIGPGSLVYGAITIGSGATILPGSVVARSVPARAVVSGNPARVIARDRNNAILRETLQADDAHVVTALQLGA